LGCTHYPFVIDVIRRLAPSAHVIDPAPAVARQVDRVLRERGLCCDEAQIGQHRFVTSGDLDQYQGILRMLVNVEVPGRHAHWSTDHTTLIEVTSKEER
jgi:glutamate racemase